MLLLKKSRRRFLTVCLSVCLFVVSLAGFGTDISQTVKFEELEEDEIPPRAETVGTVVILIEL